MRTRNTLLSLIAVGMALALAACSSTTPPSSPEPLAAPVATTTTPSSAPAPTSASAATLASGDSAYMTVYRKKRFVGMALNTSVYVDGTEVAELDPGTYVKIKLIPGQHRVWADESGDAMPITAEAGKTYYFRMELIPGVWKGHGMMVLVDETTGAKQLAEFKCKIAKDIRVEAMVVR